MRWRPLFALILAICSGFAQAQERPTLFEQPILLRIAKQGGEATPTTVRLGPDWRAGVAGLTYLRKLPRLVSLEIVDPGGTIADGGMSLIGQLSTLETLRLEGLRISNNSISNLAGLQNLHTLHLANNRLSDTALRHLQSKSTLTELSIGEPKFTGSGLRYLKRNRELIRLDLGYSGVIDKNLQIVTQFKRLEYLDVEGTQISDIALERLWSEVPKLQIVCARGGKPTRKGELFGREADIAPRGAIRFRSQKP